MKFKTHMMGLALLTAMLSGCGSMRPSIESVSPRIENIDFEAVTLAFDVQIKNPYPFKLHAPAYRYAIDIADSPFFSGEVDESLEVPAVNTGTVTLPARIGYVDLWDAVKGLASASEAPYAISGALKFNLPTGQTELPFEHEGDFPVLRPPTFTVVKTDVGEKSLRSARIDVELDVGNDNVFPLGVDGVGYEIFIGEVPLGQISVDSAGTIAAGDTGRVLLSGEMSAASALRGILAGNKIGMARCKAIGKVSTPYGEALLP
ncbi:MAG: LEA/WHy family protein [Planctomycetota bacterium]|jgi:LEA14-like dessication related protein